MKIPTFEEAKQALIEKRGTPLDKFVAYWEPAGNCEEDKFRDMLQSLMDWSGGKIHPSIAEGILEDADRTQRMMVDQNYGTQESLIRSFWNPSTNQYEEKK